MDLTAEFADESVSVHEAAASTKNKGGHPKRNPRKFLDKSVASEWFKRFKQKKEPNLKYHPPVKPRAPKLDATAYKTVKAYQAAHMRAKKEEKKAVRAREQYRQLLEKSFNSSLSQRFRIDRQTVLDCAFTLTSSPIPALTLKLSCSRRSVKRMLCMVASYFFLHQNAMIGLVVARARKEPPRWTMYRLCWDETGEKMKIPLIASSLKTTVWHILVARLRLVICFDRVYDYRLVLPTLVVASPSAACIYYQLFQHPWTVGLFTAIYTLQQLSVLRGPGIYERDGAYANDRLTAVQMSRLMPCNIIDNLCSLHQNQLTEVAVIVPTVLTNNTLLINAMYSLSLYLRSGSHFLILQSRLSLAVANADIRRISEWGPPPASATEYNRELANYAISHYQRFSISSQSRENSAHSWVHDMDDVDDYGYVDIDTDDLPSKTLMNFIQRMKEFLAVFNGPLYQAGEMVHYCLGSRNCCPQGTKKRMVAALKDVPFCHPPEVPENKWTKRGPCVDTFLFGFLCGGLWPKVFKNLKGSVTVNEILSSNLDPKLAHDMFFQVLEGARFKTGLQLVEHGAFPVCSVAFAIEPIRYLTRWLMRRAREAQDYRYQSRIFDIWRLPYFWVGLPPYIPKFGPALSGAGRWGTSTGGSHRVALRPS